LKEERTNLEREIKESKEQGEQLNKENAHLKETLASITQDIENKKGELKHKEDALNSLLAKLLPKESFLDEKKKSLINIVTDLTTQKNTVSYLSQGVEALKKKIAVNQKEKEKNRSLGTDVQTNIQEVSHNIDELREKRELFKAKLKEELHTIEQIKKEFLEKEKAFHRSKEQYTRKSSKLHSLIELDKNMGDFCEAMKSILERGETGKDIRNGIHGFVADIIETLPQYEKAVEAVLGEKLQYVITEKQEQGVEAIQYLKSENTGRGGFIPLKLREVEEGQNDNPLPTNAKAPLLDCVTIKKGYEQVIKHFLRDVILMDDIDSAVKIWEKNGIAQTIVTLDGDIIDPSGALTGGSHCGKDSGVLKRKREIKELQHTVKNLKEEEERAEEVVLRLSQNKLDAEKEFEIVREESHKLEIEELAQENDYKRLEKEHSVLKSQQELLNLEGDEFLHDLEEISSKLKATVEEKEALESKLLQGEKSLDLLEKHIKALREEKEFLFKELTDLKVVLASLREKSESLQNASCKARNNMTEIEKRLSLARERMIKYVEEEDQLLADIETLKGNLESALNEKDKSRAEKIKKEEDYQVFLVEIKTLDEEIGQRRSELSTYQKSITESQLTLKEFELKLMHLQEKVRDKYTTELESCTSLNQEEDLPKDEVKEKLELLQRKIIALGEVNLAATEELEQLEERYNFLTSQQSDLNNSIEGLHKAINKINRVTIKRFKEAYETINSKFQEVYSRLFEGGMAELRLTDESNLLECGIDIVAQPQGKKLQNVTLLSGGEKALTALSLIFSIFLIKPSPFCILDEADAPLDDANILRFNKMVTELAKKSQFILITHNKKTMEIAESLFGITMGESGISTLLSVKINDTDSNNSKVA
jgi:chromosome segregation protein